MVHLEEIVDSFDEQTSLNNDSVECAAAILGGDLGAVPPVNELDDSGKSPLHTAASAHAARCVEVSLADIRMDPNLDPNDFSVEDLVIQIGEKDLSTVKLLCEKTNDVADVAYAYAVEGHIASLTALLIAAGEKVYDSVFDSECLITEALALGGVAAPPLRAAKRASTATAEETSERRKVTSSPLIQAAQVGDEEVIRLLLRTKIDVNDADAEGNTALHWILKLSRLLCPQKIKILSLLLDHGAQVSQRNRLGLTAFHIAAGNRDLEALEVLLLEDPFGVQYKTEMKETPLFFAVKSESKECAKLLLTWGANSEVLNLRRQRAIDLATSQDMRYMLLNPTTVSLINHAFRSQHKCQDMKFFVDKSKGTTCIGWVLTHFVILGCDSRTTDNEEDIVSDTRQKLISVAPLIVSLESGTKSECMDAREYMMKKMSNEIKTGQDVRSIEKLGEICRRKKLSCKDDSFHFLIGGIQDQVPKCCYVYNSKGYSDFKWVEKYKVMGSGGTHIRELLEGLYMKLGEEAAVHELVWVVAYLLLLAALGDRCTGGVLTVQRVGEGGIATSVKHTVIELLIHFYTVEFNYIERVKNGVEKESKTKSFQHSEDHMLFLFYDLDEINPEEVDTWLRVGKKRKICADGYGHPLTELVYGYYAHRLQFETSQARDKFYRDAKTPNDKTVIPFTSSKKCFKYYKFRDQKIFVACQSLQMLQSLELSLKMREKQLDAGSSDDHLFRDLQLRAYEDGTEPVSDEEDFGSKSDDEP